MTEKTKAPRKRAAKPSVIHPDARLFDPATGRSRKLTALDKARVIMTRAQAPRYRVRGVCAQWLLSNVSPFTMTTATPLATFETSMHWRVRVGGRLGWSLRPRAYKLQHGLIRDVYLFPTVAPRQRG